MARRKKKSKAWGRLLILGGVGLAGYAAYRAGVWDWITGQTASGPTANGTTTNGGNETTQNGQGSVPSWVGTILDMIGENEAINGGKGQGELPAGAAEAVAGVGAATAAGGTASGGITFPGWLGGVPEGGATLPASRVPEALAKVLTPLVIGLSPAVPKLVHEVNVAIPGPNTGLEKGNVTLFDERGQPFIYTSAGACYDLSGRSIACPQVSGVSQPTLDWYEKLEEALT